MIEKLLEILAPHECLGCGHEGLLLCDNCASRLPAAIARCYRCRRSTAEFRTCANCKASPLRTVRAAVRYEDDGLVKALIHRFKFERAQAAAHDIAPLLQLPSDISRERIVVHVPTATSRVRQRGYDQAKLIARGVAARHGVMHVSALARIGQQRQVGASGSARRHQLQTAFRVTRPLLVAGKHVILIDDVLTSGATLEAAALTLKQAGAWRVEATVFAQA